MSNLFGILFLLSLIMLIIGLINPKLAIYWGAKRTKKEVLIYYIPIIIVSLILIGVFYDDPYKNTALAITINNPTESRIEVMTDTINIKGNITIPDAKLKINNDKIPLSGNDFNYTADLQFGENRFQIVATYYDNKIDKKEIIINRLMTAEEKAELERQQEQEATEKAKAEAEAKIKAEQEKAEAEAAVRAEEYKKAEAEAEAAAQLEEFRQGRYNAERDQQLLDELEAWKREANY